MPFTSRWWVICVIIVGFAVFGRIIRGVSNSGAVAGAVICFALFAGAGWAGFAALCLVFVLTSAATRIGYAGKLRRGTAESREGRTASQVLANLAVAAIGSLAFSCSHDPRYLLVSGAALAEAAADTVASEIGQALGGVPRLLTTWASVPPGSDGAITAAGTVAGIVAAVLVSGAYSFSESLGFRGCAICLLAALVGTLADSLLGATAEKSGLIGNNGVNFISTALAGALAFLLGRSNGIF